MRQRIDYVVAGTQKGGTSSLNLLLHNHPDAATGKVKEPHFFDTDANFAGAPDWAAYHANFDMAADVRVVGEATPDYLWWPPALARLRDYNPALKVIVLLRHPTDRAFSQWSMLRGWRDETRPFLEAVRDDVAKLSCGEDFARDDPAYVPRGFYSRQLDRLFGLFPREQVLLLKSEAMRADAQPAFDRVCDFLDLRRARLAGQPNLHHGKYARAMHPTERHYLLQVFARDVEAVERITGWDCADWRV